MVRKVLAAVAVSALLAVPAFADSTGPIAGYADGWFYDVKSPPLVESEMGATTWGMHVTYAFTNYAGLLFDLQYDTCEVSQLTVAPAGPHNGLQVPGVTGLQPAWTFPGSTSTWTTVFPLAVWVPQASASGMTVQSSGVYPLFNVGYHAKAGPNAETSDIDITASVWQILHIIESGNYIAHESDWFYMTPGGIDYEFYPGMGIWMHQPITTTVFLPASAFVATNAFIANVAGYGIEIPEPAAGAMLLVGLGMFVFARRRA